MTDTSPVLALNGCLPKVRAGRAAQWCEQCWPVPFVICEPAAWTATADTFLVPKGVMRGRRGRIVETRMETKEPARVHQGNFDRRAETYPKRFGKGGKRRFTLVVLIEPTSKTQASR